MAIKINNVTAIDDSRQLNIVGISSVSNVKITTVGTGATVGSADAVGIVTYYGDGSQLTGIGGGAGSISVQDVSDSNTYYVGITTTSTGTLTTLNVSTSNLTFDPSTGNLVAGGTVTATSDENIKTNVKTIENALDKVLSLRGVEFDRIDNKDHQIGVIAQEVEKVIPEVVYPKSPSSNDETKSVAYANLVGLLIEAIKELNQKIEEK